MELVAKNLKLMYGESLIFDNLSLAVKPGEILGIKGANGAGKSSLCLALAGLIDGEIEGILLEGEILFDGKDIREMEQKERAFSVGIVFQNPDNQIFSPLVIEELVFAPENLKVHIKEIELRLQEVLEELEISHLLEAKVNNLSGGEKQMVAIASVLMMQPQVLIVDEITSHLDEKNRGIVRDALSRYAGKGNSVIMVSHLSEDLKIADKEICLKKQSSKH